MVDGVYGGVQISANEFENLKELQRTGRYTDFYRAQYEMGSAIAGLYAAGPTGQGVFATYSHNYTSRRIGDDTFNEVKLDVSRIISGAIIESIEASRDSNGNYHIPGAIDYIRVEIRAFNSDEMHERQVFGSDYAGTRLVKFLEFVAKVINLDIDFNIIQPSLFVEVILSAITVAVYAADGVVAAYETFSYSDYYSLNGEIYNISELEEMGYNFSPTGTMIDAAAGVQSFVAPDGSIVTAQRLVDVVDFMYQGVNVRSHSGEYREEDGFLVVDHPILGEVTVGATNAHTATMLFELASEWSDAYNGGYARSSGVGLSDLSLPSGFGGVPGVGGAGDAGWGYGIGGASGSSGRDRPRDFHSRATGYDEDGAYIGTAYWDRDGNPAYGGTDFSDPDRDFSDEERPIFLDLDGDGIEVTQLNQSTHFITGADGLQHRTAWAGAGDGVLFIDADDSGSISNLFEYVFTEWDASAGNDLEALRRAFDSNGDGKLTSADARWGEFRVQVTNADGSTSVRTLAELGITEINLRADTTRITLPDGSSITGQSSFLINGVLRTLANTSLATDANGYRIVDTVTTDGAGNRVVTQTGYDAAGDRAFVVTSTTSPNGLSITNRYDMNGDGVTDQIQTITAVVSGGLRNETVLNYLGSSVETGTLLSRVFTSTSSDGRSVTVLTDSQGGGWFDEREQRVTAADGSRTVTISELARNGTVISSTSETISASGLVRTNSENLDGAGGADRITTETIVQDPTGARTVTTVVTNQDGSLRTTETETISADGRDKITTVDLNGDGVWDVKVEEDVTLVTGGGTSTVIWVRNADGSLQRQVNSTVSADGLTRTSQTNIDGDADFDQFVNDVTTIDGAGTRTRLLTVTNTDGSVNHMEKTVLGADLVTGQTWIDLNQNGVFEATDLVRQVTINASNVKTATTWDRNPDGSVRMMVTEVTNATGLQTVTTVDMDGDGDTDRTITDTTVLNGDLSATETITTVNGDGSRRSQEATTTSADGLHSRTIFDIGGSVAADRQIDTLVTNATDGAVTRVVTELAGNGTTLLGQVTTHTSADRLTTTVTADVNGDGAIDRVTTSTEAGNGSRIVESWGYHADGSLAEHTRSSVSANGLVTTTTRDINGDGLDDQVMLDATVLNADGSVTRTITQSDGDGSLASRVATTVSDDGLTATVRSDANGDGVYERTVTAATVIQANGTQVTTATTTSANGGVLSRIQTSVSDDGLVRTVRSDADGDGDYDLSVTATTAVLDNGGRQTTVETRDLAGVLRDRAVTTTTDDLRRITVQEDVNGDGNWDRVTTTIVADNGTTTRTVTETDAGGGLLARSVLTVSDDGLINTLRTDADGNGVYETRREAVTVLNADGSMTTTTTVYGADNSVISRGVVTTSDDSWITIATSDVDGDGVTDFTTQQTYSLSGAGVETVTTSLTAEDGSLLRRETVTTTADERQVTTAIDSDGNGTIDTQNVRILQDDGSIRSTTNWLSPTGGLEARMVSTLSGDGLRLTESLDRDGDGRFDLIRERVTELAANGDVLTEISWRNDRFVEQGRVRTETRENGDHVRILLDHDGDGLFEVRGEIHRTSLVDGSVVLTQRTFDASSLETAEIVTTTSGNGLVTQIASDYNGDGALDRLVSSETAGDGAISTEIRTYSSNAVLREISTYERTGDGRFEELNIDLDANGVVDQRITTQIDASRNRIVTRTDFDATGGVEESVTDTLSANGMERIITFDIDGDGDVDITRVIGVGFEPDGDRVVTRTEYASPFDPAFGLGRTTYIEQTVASADGLGSVTTYDMDGDGDIDGQTVFTRTIHADGSATDLRVTTYADGDLRERVVTETSADQRFIRETSDFDGNGIADLVVETRIGVDGTRTVTETGYDVTGLEGQTFVTETSADGLNIRIIRPDGVQTITRSVVNDGSYTWNNGVTASTTAMNVTVSHVVDSFGIETWTITRSWMATNGGVRKGIGWIGGAGSSTELRLETVTVRLDAAAKAEILAEAARIFDTVLDRDMDYSELETVILFITDGHLDGEALAARLLETPEFSTYFDGTTSVRNEFISRWGQHSTEGGQLTAVEFLTQLYLNALQRPPSMQELNDHLQDGRLTTAATAAAARAEIAVALAESAEHIVVGNGHLATNNLDVILNPAVFERSLDRAWVESIVQRLVDAVYDRDATAQELEMLSAQLLGDTANPDDLVAQLLQADGTLFQISTNSLAGLTGANLVEQAFINALGRQPTAEEQQAWEGHLAAGRLTVAQFIASLALSVEQDAAGNHHVATVTSTVTTLTGTSGGETLNGGAGQDSINGGGGNDTINGGAGADLLIGGAGADYLNGGTGSDIYRWSRGDGNDTISAVPEQMNGDQLQLLNVASTDVTAGIAMMLIVPPFPGATPYYVPQYYTISVATASVTETISFSMNGHISIQFSDGVIWTEADFLSRLTPAGTSGADSISGTVSDDFIASVAGDDTVSAGAGDDTLTGGTGNDHLSGGAGSDTYRWSVGDGNDTINDGGTATTDADVLELTGVLPGQVALSRPVGSLDLIVTITVGGVVSTITVTGQYAAIRGGIEAIRFADGASWDFAVILSRTIMQGTTGSDNLVGTALADYIGGGEGNDTISTSAGDDTLVGGGGNDALAGGEGSDTYRWSVGDGNDTISDGGALPGELDRLELAGVDSSGITLTRNVNFPNDLWIGIGSEMIRITGFFSGAAIEEIAFADGTIWTTADILARTWTSGSNSAETLLGLTGADNLVGWGGNDTINGAAGDDYIYGGTGNDVLDGGLGSDRYYWSSGDGNDTISESGTSLSEVDSLMLTGISANAVSLTRSGSDLLITLSATGEVIRIVGRFANGASGQGIEIIEFGDGTVMRVLNTAVGTIETTGTGAANALTGWGFRDLIEGLAGNDTLSGAGGDDTLVGGAGLDSLAGGEGGDTYEWTRGDGADTINDASLSTTAVDRLLLTDVAGGDVVLLREQGSWNLQVMITTGGATEVITILNQFGPSVSGVGIEMIELADGTVWHLDEILSRTQVRGTSGNDTLTGTSYQDNFYGGAGNDTISGNDGDDRLVGGTGQDSLVGGNGSDSYVWERGDGNDTINDTSASVIQSDTLVLSNVLTNDVALTRQSGATALQIVINTAGTTETITVTGQFDTGGTGIERIQFANGVIWDLEQILAATRLSGDGSANTLSGTISRDNIFGLAGNDTLNGDAGNDWLEGGDGNDLLVGGAGSDSYLWLTSHGNDTINEISTGAGEADVLILGDANAGSVTLYRVSGSGDLVVRVATGTSTFSEIRVLGQTSNQGADDGIPGVGIEIIRFADGSEWSLSDIIERSSYFGTAANDTIIGSDLNDRIVSGDGDDSIMGMGGNDTLRGGLGADTIIGGSGSDVVDYTGASTALTIDLRLSSAQVGVAGGIATGDVLGSVEGIIGASYNDSLVGNDESNWISGGAGDDTLAGLDGFDELYGGSGNDSINGGLGADALFGGDGDDTLVGADGADSFDGGAGNDILIGGSGGNLMVGGEGNDIVAYWNATAGVTVDLQNSASNTGEATGDTYTGIENVAGTNFNDSIFGDAQDNRIAGYLGDDQIAGRSGNDTLDGGSGNDVLIGGLGADYIIGGDGIDAAAYWNAATGLRADLLVSSLNTGEAAGDTYSGVENLIGSGFGDTLSGNAVGNVIFGGLGNDLITGNAGNDTLRGDDGNDMIAGNEGSDILYGGFGSDTFIFDRALGSDNVDVIADFVAADDTIQLAAAIFTALSAGTLTASAFTIGTAATTAAHRIIYDQTTGRLYYDADGTGAGASVLFASVTAGVTLSTADFVIA